MGFSINGIAKTLPVLVPAPPIASSSGNDPAGFRSALSVATATEATPAPAGQRAAITAASTTPPQEKLLLEDESDLLETAAPGRQIAAASGKDEPADEGDVATAASEKKDGRERKTTMAVSQWPIISPHPHAIASIVPPVAALAPTQETAPLAPPSVGGAGQAAATASVKALRTLPPVPAASAREITPRPEAVDAPAANAADPVSAAGAITQPPVDPGATAASAAPSPKTEPAPAETVETSPASVIAAPAFKARQAAEPRPGAEPALVPAGQAASSGASTRSGHAAKLATTSTSHPPVAARVADHKSEVRIAAGPRVAVPIAGAPASAKTDPTPPIAAGPGLVVPIARTPVSGEADPTPPIAAEPAPPIVAGPGLVVPVARAPVSEDTNPASPITASPRPAVPVARAPVSGKADPSPPVAAEPGLAVPVARVPLPALADPAVAVTSNPIAATPVVAAPLAAAPASVSWTTGGALAAAAVHAVSSAGKQGDGRRGSDHVPAPDAIDVASGVAAAGTAATPGIATPAAAASRPATDAVLDTRDPTWMATLLDKMTESRDAHGTRAITMTLRPDALGAVEVSLKHSAGQLHVVFTAADPAARSLLADARPLLAAIAGERGIDLASTTITGGGAGPTGDGAGRQPDQRPAALPFANWGPARASTEESPESTSFVRMRGERTA